MCLFSVLNVRSYEGTQSCDASSEADNLARKREISDGMLAIVDGFTGTIYVDPDEETLEKYQKLQEEDERKKRLLQELKGKENVTLDGTKINIYANIGGIDNVGAVLLNDAGGIG